MIIDMFGKPCPMPVVAAKKELDAGCSDLQVLVDNETAVQNLSRLARRSGLQTSSESIDGGFAVTFVFPEGFAADSEATCDISTIVAECADCTPAPEPSPAARADDFALFIGKDHVGDGDETLGRNLMKMALYTFSQADPAPSSVLLMNGGVRLACQEGQVFESLEALKARGAEILVCGTCLDFYGIKDQLLVGDVSNMYDITQRMRDAAKVITL